MMNPTKEACTTEDGKKNQEQFRVMPNEMSIQHCWSENERLLY